MVSPLIISLFCSLSIKYIVTYELGQGSNQKFQVLHNGRVSHIWHHWTSSLCNLLSYLQTKKNALTVVCLHSWTMISSWNKNFWHQEKLLGWKNAGEVSLIRSCSVTMLFSTKSEYGISQTSFSLTEIFPSVWN